jgi:hypothetical protein
MNRLRQFSKYMVMFTMAYTMTATLFTSPTLAELNPGEAISLGGADASQNLDVRGYAKGSVALFKTLAERDSAQNRCMGYGSLTPDHTIDISAALPKLTLQLKTRSQDTTLIVEGPNNRLYCVDDSSEGGKDAGLTLTDLKAGTYKVWVGAFEPGAGFRYTLSIQAQ